MFENFENNDTTFYGFQSSVRHFLSELLSHPFKTKPNKYLTDRGMTRQKLINILLKRDVLRRHEKVDDTNPNEVKYVLKYNVVRKNFEKKLKRIYTKYFEQNKEEKEIDEATVCGAASGPVIAPLTTTPLRRNYTNESIDKKSKKIYISEKQLEELKETLTTFNAGDYTYDAPISIDKNDPTLVHRKKGGISMERQK